jgi:hypothetical protein
MYATENFIKEGIDFSAVFPARQDTLRSMNYDFGLLEISNFIRIQSDNFTLEKPELLDMDAQLAMIVERYKEEEGIGVPKAKKMRQPKPEPAPEPAPAPEEDEELSAEKIQEEINAMGELLEFIDDAAQRAIIEEELESLRVALEYAE